MDATVLMANRNVVITGATSGIGFYTALGLARLGAHVYVTGRDAARGRAAVADLRRRAGHEHVTLLLADSSTVAGNDALAAEVVRQCDRLDVLVANVGGMQPAGGVTAEGLDPTLAIELVGTVALIRALTPLLEATGTARVVVVGSSAFKMWKGDPFTAPAPVVPMEAEARGKLLRLLASLALARQLAPRDVVVHTTNPGMAWTPGTAAFTRDMVPAWRFIWPLVRFFQRRASAENAARSSIALASDPTVAVPGAYYDGLRREELPARLQDTTIQDRALALAEELATRARGTAATNHEVRT